jgi:hypothetical protein
LAASGGQQIALFHHLQSDGRAGEGQAESGHQSYPPTDIKHHAHGSQGTANDLCAYPTKDGASQVPQACGLEFKSDQEQHQHDTKLGKVQDVLNVTHQPQSPWPNGNACGKVADD